MMAYGLRFSDWSSDFCSSDLVMIHIVKLFCPEILTSSRSVVVLVIDSIRDYVIILGDNIAWATHSVANRHKTNFCHLIKRFVEALKLNQSQDKPCIQSREVDRSGGFTIMRIIACARL